MNRNRDLDWSDVEADGRRMADEQADRDRVTIPLTPHRWKDTDHWESKHVLSFTDRRGSLQRAMLGFIGPNGEARQVQDGPMVRGPWAYAFTLGWAITANPQMSTAAERRRNLEAGTEHDVHPGSIIELVVPDSEHPGVESVAYTFEFSLDRGEFPVLTLVDDEEPDLDAPCVVCGSNPARPGYSVCDECG